jgi:hypothetical protein
MVSGCFRNALLFVLAVAVLSPAYAIVNVVYPKWDVKDTRQEFYYKVLKLALGKAGNDFELKPSELVMDQGRALVELSRGQGVSVVWTMTSKEREASLLPIRIPLDMGLMGLRIFLIRQEDAEVFAKIKSLDDLRKYQAGQGHDWPDTQTLLANGLAVQTSPVYASLFKMLQASRFDYFPRSVTEIWEEKRSRPEMRMAVEKTVLLQYTAPFYFFVKKSDKALADAIEKGLRTAIKDGSFKQLFMTEFGQDLKQANLKNRTVIKLDNPTLPPETPLQDKSLWYGL